jgi:SAM-dependent methyltransferase
MREEVQSNQAAWARVAQDHYQTFRKAFQSGTYALNAIIRREVGDLAGKRVLHLQCNTGADTLCLRQMGAAYAMGVDLVPENIAYARRLAADLSVSNVDFLQSDIMELSCVHDETYDVVFTSEGVLGWLPDLTIWAQTIRKALRPNGYFYIFDSHPFGLAFDEQKLADEIYAIRYPYFGKQPDEDDAIGGYASPIYHGVKTYFWMHTVSDILNALIGAGLQVEFFNEYAENFFNPGGMQHDRETGLYSYPYNTGKYPMTFSLKATVRPGR